MIAGEPIFISKREGEAIFEALSFLPIHKISSLRDARVLFGSEVRAAIEQRENAGPAQADGSYRIEKLIVTDQARDHNENTCPCQHGNEKSHESRFAHIFLFTALLSSRLITNEAFLFSPLLYALRPEKSKGARSWGEVHLTSLAWRGAQSMPSDQVRN